ncbi:MAG: phosphoribosylformylglycinamidine synthase subunit PurL [bacterium]|jgi:phosphoribosylformylglycinamidine synthase II|nr:phosphoribosylformylglycinamidine synthase subunit PurL [bacterium]MDD3805707.1 phosphoribosylformylglycinamidine synthase subunit PurL [bacterium]
MIEPKVYREMGLNDVEYAQVMKILGRHPNYTEVGMYAVMWSEHCGYKYSRPVLKLFPTTGPRVLQGPGENAGAVDVGDGMAVVMKIESHNHPSAVEPYEGAATGVGGIVRDIFTMGARPMAALNSLRFGELSDARTRYLFDRAVSGIAGYGNCIGVPSVAGEVYFDDSYEGNPLINAMCLGLVKSDKIARSSASGVGNPVMYVGAKTGRDGIHGATFASVELSDESEERRSPTQVGDPFTEKLLIEATLEALNTGHIVGIQDMGAAGLTCSTTEMAAKGDSGMEVDISLVPRREEGMTPYEVMLSESQERMLLVAAKGHENEVKGIFEKWGLNAVVIGRLTDDGIVRIYDNGELAAEVPAKSLAEDTPVYHMDARIPDYIAQVRRFDKDELPQIEDFEPILELLLRRHNIASKEYIYRQYDHMAQINTVVLPGSDAAVLRLKGTGRGLAVTVDCNSRYCYLDPYIGSAIAVAEAARNVVCSGAEPAAVTDCLNFGNPEKPEIFWQFRQAVEGISAACRAFGVPVISGNVSFYNESQGIAIYPTPAIGVLGVIENIERRCTSFFKNDDDAVVLLGFNGPGLDGSEYLKAAHGRVAGCPSLDLDKEKRLQACCLEAIRSGLLASAHDIAEGGLAVALAESCFNTEGSHGVSVEISSDGLRQDDALFGEAQSRILVSLDPSKLDSLIKLAAEHDVPLMVIGAVGGSNLIIDLDGSKIIDLKIEKIESAWRGSIEEALA